jgi:hypothetical protein
VSAPEIVAPRAPAGPWESLSRNEQAWIEFIRVISCGRDPRLTTARVAALRTLLEEASSVGS